MALSTEVVAIYFGEADDGAGGGRCGASDVRTERVLHGLLP